MARFDDTPVSGNVLYSAAWREKELIIRRFPHLVAQAERVFRSITELIDEEEKGVGDIGNPVLPTESVDLIYRHIIDMENQARILATHIFDTKYLVRQYLQERRTIKL